VHGHYEGITYENTMTIGGTLGKIGVICGAFECPRIEATHIVFPKWKKVPKT